MKERTLIIFKPDCMQKRLVGTVLSRFDAAGFIPVASKVKQLDMDILNKHYAHITSLPFFPEIAAFMMEVPVLIMVLEGEDVIQKVRDMLGPTDSTKAEKGTIRGDFGTNKTLNICHASDSVESAMAEIDRFFEPKEVIPVKK